MEVHCAHGYLLSAFLSSTLNTRIDEYAGLEGGIKFSGEIVQEIKRQCGQDYPVLCRINGDDYAPSGYAAVDAAEYLASQGKLVNIVTERNALVPGMGYTSRGYLLKRFFRANIRICSSVKVKEINNRGILLEKGDITFLLDADTVIISVGEAMREGFAKVLKEQAREVYNIGDCHEVGNAMIAIKSAYDVAIKI